MYVPQHFAETRPEQLHRLIQAHPLGTLVTQTALGLDADHLPFELEPGAGDHGLLFAHVSRANPLWQLCPTGSRVMVVFRGAQAYVSPSWYPSKHATHRQVPTWNYEVVHAHGVLRVMDEGKFARRIVALLTRRHEAGEASPWKMGDAPRDYLDQMLSQIVGLEVAITRLEGKRKLSQNKEAGDRAAAAAQLRQRGHGALASAMEHAAAGAPPWN